MFYSLFPVFVFLVAFIGYKSKKTGLFLLFLMCFLSMFRGDTVGTDTMSYLDNAQSSYQAIEYVSEGITKRLELIYFSLTYIISSNNIDPHYLIYTLSIITFLFLYLSSRRFNANLTLVALFYVFFAYYYYSFNVARQFAALSVGLYALSFLTEKSRKKYLFFLWVIVGSMLHNSMILFLFLFLLKDIKMDRKKSIIIVGGMYCLMTLIPVTHIFLSILSRTGSQYSEGYGMDGAFDAGGVNTIGILYSLFSIFFYIYFYNKRTENRQTDVLDVIFLVSLLVKSALTYGNLGTWRLVMNFTAFHCFYLAIVLQKKYSKPDPIYLLYMLINYYFVIQFDDGDYYLRLM